MNQCKSLTLSKMHSVTVPTTITTVQYQCFLSHCRTLPMFCFEKISSSVASGFSRFTWQEITIRLCTSRVKHLKQNQEGAEWKKTFINVLYCTRSLDRFSLPMYLDALVLFVTVALIVVATPSR